MPLLTLCTVLLISVNRRREFFLLTIRDPFKLAKTRSILIRCHDCTLQTKGQVLLIHWPFCSAHTWSVTMYICAYMLFN